MVETVLLEYLNEALPVPAFMEFPEENAPDEYVILTKIGGDMTDWIYRSTVEFQCVSTSLADAAKLCEELKDVMNSAASLPEITRARYAGDYNATFTASKSYRYKAVYEITHY